MNVKLADLLTRFTSRSTLFCTAFFVVGHALFYLGKLAASDYNMYMGVLLSAVVGHSVSCSWFDMKNKNGNGNGNGSPPPVAGA